MWVFSVASIALQSMIVISPISVSVTLLLKSNINDKVYSFPQGSAHNKLPHYSSETTEMNPNTSNGDNPIKCEDESVKYDGDFNEHPL